MTLWVPIALVAVAVAGCQSEQPKLTASSARPSVLDISPPSSTYSPAYVPPPASATFLPTAPATAVPASAVVSQTPAASKSDSARYTVKKGDTLFRIAKDHYGDGKQWQKIAAANPGLTPGSLKAGQTLVMP